MDVKLMTHKKSRPRKGAGFLMLQTSGSKA
jgi:hypothetical protein